MTKYTEYTKVSLFSSIRSLTVPRCRAFHEKSVRTSTVLPLGSISTIHFSILFTKYVKYSLSFLTSLKSYLCSIKGVCLDDFAVLSNSDKIVVSINKSVLNKLDVFYILRFQVISQTWVSFPLFHLTQFQCLLCAK